MKRNTMNFIVDLASLLFLIIVTFSGIVLKYVLPGPPGPTFWALSKGPWRDIHWWTSVVFCVLIIIHIVLHWAWVKGYVKSAAKNR